ncbi:MAG: hypothetical protein JST10_12225 [Bacteroidetes bacterium]|nr:hypothetical protein [Bacteroidota bacterium]MBS1633327.1 hypothetical protein [Bacteroidota bacterium]
MRFMKWIGLAAAVSLAVACFYPWVFIESKNIIVTGVRSEGTDFGKPGYFHLFMIAFFLLFNFIPRVWAKRSNLLVVALNLAWAIRNYMIISSCHMGECPEKRVSIYILLFSSILLLVSALFPDVNISKVKSDKSLGK